jgi:succinoglycan biosynthesis transport protein ExoP
MDKPQLPARRSTPRLIEAPTRAVRSPPPPPMAEVTNYEPLVDLRAIFYALYRHRYLILAVIAASIALGALSLLILPQIYEATAKVEIAQDTGSPLKADSSAQQQPSEETYLQLQTQVDLLGTRDMADGVLKHLTELGGPYKQIASRYAPEDLQNNLTVFLPRNSRILSINYDNRDPKVAALIANAYATTLIDRNLQTRFDASSYARDFLQKQLGLAKGRLENSEREMIRYARSAGLLDPSAGAGGGGEDTDTTHATPSLTTSNLLQMNSSYSQARAARIQAQQKWQQSLSTPLMNLPDVLTNSTVQQLTQQRAELQAKLQENRQRYRDDHPLIQQEVANIAELDRQIHTMAESIRDSIRDQYLVAARQENAFASSVGQLKGATLAEQDLSVRYNILKREADTNRQLYDGLLQRYKEVSAEAGATSNNIAVVDRAVAPLKPISPDPKKNLALSGIGGLLLALMLAFGRERMDTRVKSPERVDEEVAVRLLGVIPLVSDGAPVDAILNPRSAMSEACHSLRTAIELGIDGGAAPSILVTSTRSQEGKSSTALGLAYSFADAGSRVLLIDGDLRRPALHHLIGIDNPHGFAEVLEGSLTLRQAIRSSEPFKVDVLTAGLRPDSPAALLDPEKIREIMDKALATYDRVIVDGPPIMGIADGSRLAAGVSATLFVLKSQGVTKDEARFALRRLQSEQISVLGAVLTMYDARGALSSSYYTYGYPEPVT